MFVSLCRRFIILFLVLSISVPALAQQPPGAGGSGLTTGPRRQLATIIFAGLGGAVLGLSTLSFYGRPQDYLSNIAVGFAVGIIIGTVVVTFKAASSPGEFYGSNGPGAQYFPTIHDRDLAFSNGPPAQTLQLNWKF